MKKIYTIPFGADFIYEIKKLIEKDPLSRTAVVFSGKRPSLYLKKCLAEGFSQPFYPPRCYSVDEFFDHISRKKYHDFTDLEYTDAVWFLYQSIQSMKVFSEHPFMQKGFGNFFYWGRHILNFIDQLDNENVTDKILLTLQGNAKIGYDVPESVNNLLLNISEVRNKFHEILIEKKYFTKGFKRLCTSGLTSGMKLDEFEKVYFAGLFALTGTEKKIVKDIWLNNEAEIIIEGNPENWHILENLSDYIGSDVEAIDALPSRPELVKVYSALDSHSEVLKIKSILKNAESSKTAIVLPLTESLFPLLTFAVDQFDIKYNISLGYPFKRTSIFDLIENIISAQKTRRRKHFYSAKDYLHVMLNPFVKNLNNDDELRSLLLNIEKSVKGEIPKKATLSKPFLTLTEIEAECELAAHNLKPNTNKRITEINTKFFRNFENINNLLELSENIEVILEYILNHTNVSSYILSGEIFKIAFESLYMLKQAAFSGEPFSSDDDSNRSALYDFMLNYLKQINIPFDTKPIEEIEIIGMLETRNLSFETVIVLDVNEGIIPSPKKVDPLVPLGVYESIGIPTPAYNEEIYRYHFYRLISSAKNVHLLYIDTDNKQRSRYIENIIWEKEKELKTLDAIPVEQSSFKINLKFSEISPEIIKNKIIIGQLKSRPLSPSSVDDYITCPILFYYKNILKFEQKKDIKGDIDSSDRGNIIHRILFDTLNAFIGKEISASIVDQVMVKLHKSIEDNFKDKVVTGDYYLFKKLTLYKLEFFLRKNINNSETAFIIKYLEKSIDYVKIDIGGFDVGLKGRIDRVDYFPDKNEYMIMDYKTGGSKQYPQSIAEKTDFDSIKDIHDKVNSFQLPIYVYLFLKTHPVSLENINAKLIMLKDNKDELLFNDSLTAENKEILFEKYIQGLKTVLRDMTDTSKPFKPFDYESCPECTFINLCHI